MAAFQPSRNGRRHFVLCLLALALLAGSGRAGDAPGATSSDLFPRDFLVDPNAATSPIPSTARANRIRLFRFVPGFAWEPAGLDFDDPAGPETTPAEADPGLAWLQVAVGSDNPFLDLRRPGDPGGIGYYRMHTQVQLFDSPTTGCALALRAVTPAGRECNGIANGPTFVSPALSFFQALDNDFALQAFVGKHMRLDSPVGPSLRRSVEYGLALNRPLTDETSVPGRVYVFLEALGRYRYDDTEPRPAVWEVVPGLHWQMNDNWWLSGGWIVPMSAPRTEGPQWLISCWMQF